LTYKKYNDIINKEGDNMALKEFNEKELAFGNYYR